MIDEKDYTASVTLSHRKKYAQFFTPEPIADFMATWVLEGRKDEIDILEPAFGLGIFTRSIYKQNSRIKVTGYEIDPNICACAASNLTTTRCNASIHNEDYLTASWADKYSGIICNPPYLKFHDYDNATLVPLANKKLGTRLSGFTNIYTLFLLKSVHQLKNGGRMAYIIPSEFMNSDYGVEVKRALLQSGVLRHIIIVNFTQCAFDDALTTACILLCQRGGEASNILFSRIDRVEQLRSALSEFTAYEPGSLDPKLKWKQYYEHTASSRYAPLVPFSTFAKVSRGIATGANDYFTFKESKAKVFGIPRNCLRHCVCHAADVPGLFFTDEDFKKLAAQEKNAYLFDGCADRQNPCVIEYVRMGEETGMDKRHLTANRQPWYALERRQPAPIWVSVFNRKGLRFVRNLAGAYNLTTFHCIYNTSQIDTDLLFAYLTTDVAKEIFSDNSRQYGNGLVKFEPNDLNKGNVADLRILTQKERSFVHDTSSYLRYTGAQQEHALTILDRFFRERFSI